jgi:hypothetical protein
MAKVFIYPATSLILSDMVARFGHTPLSRCRHPRTHPDRRTRIPTAPDHSRGAQKRPEVGGRGSAQRCPGPDVPLRADDRGLRGRDHHQRRRLRVRLHGMCPDQRADQVPRAPEGYPKLDLNYPKNEEEGVKFVAAIKRFLIGSRREEMTPPVRIAQLSCGPEYSGVQHEIEIAAKEVGGEIFFPDIALKDIRRDFDQEFGLDVRSPDLKTRDLPGHAPWWRAGWRPTQSSSPPASAVPRPLLSGTNSGAISRTFETAGCQLFVYRADNFRNAPHDGWKPSRPLPGAVPFSPGRPSRVSPRP